MIEIKNLTKYYGNILAIKNLNFQINKGEIFGFIGPNGAGKSTTIRCIMNLINKTEGEIFIEGINIENQYKYKESIGYLPSEINLYDDLNVMQMIEYSNSFYEKDCLKRAKDLLKRLDLPQNKKINELSLGNTKKLGIVLALMHNPKILILDEASSGLDPLMQEEFYKILLEEKAKGTTIFFSSHNLNEIKKICDRVGIIKAGSLIKIETIKDLLKDSLQIVTIISKDINKIIERIDCISNDEVSAKFIYKDSPNKLIHLLSKYDIEKISIEEPSIEEVFMHYYK